MTIFRVTGPDLQQSCKKRGLFRCLNCAAAVYFSEYLSRSLGFTRAPLGSCSPEFPSECQDVISALVRKMEVWGLGFVLCLLVILITLA